MAGAYYTGTGLSLPGNDGNYASTPDNVALDVTKPDVRVKCAASQWARAGLNQTLVSHYVTNGWMLVIGGTGLLVFFWFDGTGTSRFAVSTASVPSVVANGVTVWLRCTHDSNNGAGNSVTRYYYSLDGTTWTQLGADVVTAGVTGLTNGAGVLTVGGHQSIANRGFYGTFDKVEVRPTLDGAIVASPDFTVQPYGEAPFADGTGKTWTLVNSEDPPPTGRRVLGLGIGIGLGL